jgi:hypothetical protein
VEAIPQKIKSSLGGFDETFIGAVINTTQEKNIG